MPTRSFKITPYVSAGNVSLGVSKDVARKNLEERFESFKRTPIDVEPCDYFPEIGVFVYYDNENNVEAIELASPAIPTLNQTNLLDLNFGQLINFMRVRDSSLQIESDSLISLKLGIGAYSGLTKDNRNAKVDSIIIFKREYYD